MKRLFLSLGAFALLGLSSCVDQVDVNPNYDPDTKTVTTNFIFNISTDNNVVTKQNDAVAQKNGDFRGIDNAKLYYYQQPSDGGILYTDQTVTEANMYNLKEVASPNSLSADKSTRVLEMSLPLGTNTMLFYGKAIADNPENYEQYGHMEEFTLNTTAGSTKFTLGNRLHFSGDNSTQAKQRFYAVEKCISAALSIIMNTNLAGDNHVLVDKDQAPEHTGSTMATYGFTIAATDYPEIYWSNYKNLEYALLAPSDNISALEKRLKDSYNQMTKIYTSEGELRAASGPAILSTVADLWSSINAVRCATPMEESEALAKFFAEQVHQRLKRYFTPNSVPEDGGAITSVGFNSAFLTNLAADINADDSKNIKPRVSVTSIPDGASAEDFEQVGNVYNAKYDWPTSNDIQLASATNALSYFPFIFGLPRGATHISFNKYNEAFYYPTTFNTNDVNGVMEGGSFNAESYYYPAELMYFGNSPVYVTDDNVPASDYQKTSAAWKQYDWLNNNWSLSHVSASTHAVAMKYDINYGSALLETHIKYKTSLSTQTGEGEEAVTTYYLQDNNRAVQARLQNVNLNNTEAAAAFQEQDKHIPITNSSFLLKGIIIAGQPKNVGWDYLPVPSSGTTYTYGFVYDNAIPTDAQQIPLSGSSEANYTVLLDNFLPAAAGDNPTTGPRVAAATQSEVTVALELQNNSGYDFYGNYNLIKDQGYFYLIGKLTIPAYTDEQLAAFWPSDPTKANYYNYVHPPYKRENPNDENSAVVSQKILRVFMQDFVTKVTFSMNTRSLQAAYLTVPDLRSGAMTLGLSVSLDWRTGIELDEVPLGGSGYAE